MPLPNDRATHRRRKDSGHRGARTPFNPTTRTSRPSPPPSRPRRWPVATPTSGRTPLRRALAQGDGTPRRCSSRRRCGRRRRPEGTDRSSEPLPSASGSSVSAPQLSWDALAAITAAQQLATEMGDEYVSTEHPLVGSRGPAARSPSWRRSATALLPDALRDAFGKVRGSARDQLFRTRSGSYQA
ncbi:hypothetical protein HBB16_05510 [Pseudonocardia sp. MCCB 268]|nr:hypothetical protein [Pseudonocardia cytotoxica]